MEALLNFNTEKAPVLGVNNPFKGILHPKCTILSSFTHPNVVTNLCEFLSSAEHKRRYFEECGKPKS